MKQNNKAISVKQIDKRIYHQLISTMKQLEQDKQTKKHSTNRIRQKAI